MDTGKGIPSTPELKSVPSRLGVVGDAGTPLIDVLVPGATTDELKPGTTEPETPGMLVPVTLL